mmetsp:Transcript_36653/g.80057  ORF Transcript_36653/g.80057 Transcript_36653/m.80057 type:complete len:201 (-) Transcript_36653:1673-2275(-)
MANSGGPRRNAFQLQKHTCLCRQKMADAVPRCHKTLQNLSAHPFAGRRSKQGSGISCSPKRSLDSGLIVVLEQTSRSGLGSGRPWHHRSGSRRRCSWRRPGSQLRQPSRCPRCDRRCRLDLLRWLRRRWRGRDLDIIHIQVQREGQLVHHHRIFLQNGVRLAQGALLQHQLLSLLHDVRRLAKVLGHLLGVLQGGVELEL